MIMSAQLLQIKDLSVKVEDKEILHNVDLNLNKGERHAGKRLYLFVPTAHRA